MSPLSWLGREFTEEERAEVELCQHGVPDECLTGWWGFRLGLEMFRIKDRDWNKVCSHRFMKTTFTIHSNGQKRDYYGEILQIFQLYIVLEFSNEI